jgi:hypothetical protein
LRVYYLLRISAKQFASIAQAQSKCLVLFSVGWQVEFQSKRFFSLFKELSFSHSRFLVICFAGLGSCVAGYEYANSDPSILSHVQISRDGWRPMYISDPEVNFPAATTTTTTTTTTSGYTFDEDVVNYDYGSLEDEAEVVVRPFEVQSQVRPECLLRDFKHCRTRKESIYKKYLKIFLKILFFLKYIQ